MWANCGGRLPGGTPGGCGGCGAPAAEVGGMFPGMVEDEAGCEEDADAF